MARPVRFHREAQSRFSNLFTGLCQRKSSCEVWADFVSMAAISISNVVDREGKTHDDREKQYLRTIQGYNQTEQQVFPKLFALLAEALEDEPDQDFLGEMFMGLNLGNHWKGQFFTPYNVCRMMAEMQADGIEERVQRQGWISVNDPCCGAGALLIAFRNAMVRRKLGPDTALGHRPHGGADVLPTALLVGLCRVCGSGRLPPLSHGGTGGNAPADLPHARTGGMADARPLRRGMGGPYPVGAGEVRAGEPGGDAKRVGP